MLTAGFIPRTGWAADATGADAPHAGMAAASPAVATARHAIDAGRFDAAVQALEPWLEQHPKDARAWFLAGVAYARAKRYPLAIDAFRKVAALKPDLPEPHTNLAAVYHALGDDALAINELELALMLKPDSARFERDLAELHLREALRHYRKSLKLAPDPTLQGRYARIERAAKGQDEPPMSLPDTAAVAPPLPHPSEPAPAGPAGDAGKRGAASDESERLTEVLDAIENWRAAWSARDLDRYFAAYAEDFRPPARFGSLAAWKRYKRRVIGNKPSIRVELEDVRVTFSPDGHEAHAHFVQHYRAGGYRSDDRKELTFRRMAQGWKIVREEVAP